MFIFISCISDESALYENDTIVFSDDAYAAGEKELMRDTSAETDFVPDNYEEEPLADTDLPVEDTSDNVVQDQDTVQPAKQINQWGTNGAEIGNSVAADAEGNVYVAGATYGALDGNPCVMNGTQCSRDVFLTKFSPTGSKLWTKQWGSSGVDAANAVAVDGEGNIFVTGYVNGEFNGQVPLGNGDAFLMKVRSDGSVLWTSLWGSGASDGGVGLAVDKEGTCYVAGSTRGAIDDNTITGTLSCSASDGKKQYCSDVFVTKFNADGVKVWTKMWGTAVTDEALGIAVDAAGALYIAGYTEGALEGNTLLGNKDIFLSKLAADGTMGWTKQWGTTERDEATGVAADSAGNIFIAGKTNEGLDGNSCSKALGKCTMDAFLTCFKADGSKTWTKQLGSNADESADSITLDASGNIYIAGFTKGGLDGNTNAGVIDGFVTKFSADGAKLWTKMAGTPKNDSAKGVAVSGSGMVYLTGETYGIFPGNVSMGNQDAFLWSYKP